MIHKIKRVTLKFFFFLLVLVAIGSSLVRVFLMSIDDYKTVLESKIFELTEIPLKIGHIQANMRGVNPSVILKDLRILAPENSNHQIKLEEIRVSLSLIDLIMTQELLPSTWLTLVGMKLSVVRMEDGGVSILGLNVKETDQQPYWLLDGHYEVVRSEITWLDKRRHAAPLVIKDIDIIFKKNVETAAHEIHLMSHLPDSVGGTLRVSMSFQGDLFEKKNINGLLYIKGVDVRLDALLTGDKPFGLKMESGRGDFEFWSRWEQSENISLTGQVQLEKLNITKQEQVYKADKLTTAFRWDNLQDGWRIAVTDFKIKKEGIERLPASFFVSANKQFSQVSTAIDQIDLQQLSETVNFFAPLDKEHQQMLVGMEIKGQLNNFSSYIDTDKKIFAINGAFNNVFTSAYEEYPQIDNLSVNILGTDKLGDIRIKTQKASLFFPELFRQPIPINQLIGKLSWQQLDDSWVIEAEKLILDVKDAQTKSKLKVSISKNDAPVFMSLKSEISNLNDVSNIRNYYPVGIMTDDALSWLDSAFVSGEIKTGSLLLEGNLGEFPFANGQGVFEVALDASHVELQFAPDWPHLNDVNANILFHRGGVEVKSDYAIVQGINITKTIVKIPDFEKSEYVLVQGRALGKVNQGLSFLQKTPLHGIADGLLDVFEASGKVDVFLDTQVPLVSTVEASVEGVIRLEKVGLNIKAMDLKLTDANGNLTFSEKGLYSKKIMAKVLGNPVSIDLETNQGRTIIYADGTASIRELKTQFDFLNTKIVTQNIKGTLEYQLELDLPSDKTKRGKLTIATDLEGVSLNFPAWLKKRENEEKSLNMTFWLSNSKLLLAIINFNNDIKVAMQIDKQQEDIYSANVVFGHGRPVIPKAKFFNVSVNQTFFDITEWMAFFDTHSGQQRSNRTINNINFKTKNLKMNDQNYGLFDLTVTQKNQLWTGQVESSFAKGSFVIPAEHLRQKKIKLDMEFLNLSALMDINLQQTDEHSEMGFRLFDISSKRLLWNGNNLGSLEIQTERLPNGLKFNKVNVLKKDFQIKMNAEWTMLGKRNVTTFSGMLEAKDMGKVLSEIGVKNDLKETSASVEYVGHWPSSPHQISLEDVEANVDVKLKNGRISSINPGLGRALGFLAMEQWIKRLSFGFGDLYKKGLSFNSISGLFLVEQGFAHTDRLFVDSVPAQIIIAGDTDILTKTLDYTVDVVPKSSEAIPIAGTIINGIAGTITQILTSDYKDGYFFGSKYHVTGKWGNIELVALHDESGVFSKTWNRLTELFQSGSGKE